MGVGAQNVAGSLGSSAGRSSSCSSCGQAETAESGSPWSLNPSSAADMWPSARGEGSPGAPETPCRLPVAAATSAAASAAAATTAVAAATAITRSPGSTGAPSHPPPAAAAAAAAADATADGAAVAAADTDAPNLRPTCFDRGTRDRTVPPQKAYDASGTTADRRSPTVNPRRAPGTHLKAKATSPLGAGVAVSCGSGSVQEDENSRVEPSGGCCPDVPPPIVAAANVAQGLASPGGDKNAKLREKGGGGGGEEAVDRSSGTVRGSDRGCPSQAKHGRSFGDDGGDGLRRAVQPTTGNNEGGGGGGADESSLRDAAPPPTPVADVEERIVDGDVSIIEPFPATTGGQPNAEEEARPHPDQPAATTHTAGTGSPPPPSVLPMFGEASTRRADPGTPPRSYYGDGSVGRACGKRSDDIEKRYFTEGAAEKGRTNWAAAVCGRCDLPRYPEENESSGALDAVRAALQDWALAAASAGSPRPAATRQGATHDSELAAGVASGGRLGRRQRLHDPARPACLVRKPPRVPCLQQQHLAFTSEDESGGGGEAGGEAAADSLVTNSSFEELPESALAWGLSGKGARRVARPTNAGVGSTTFGRTSRETSPTKRALKGACGSGPRSKSPSPSAAPTTADKTEVDVEAPAGDEPYGEWPRAQSPTATVAAHVFAGDAASLSVALPAVKHTAETGGAGDAAAQPQDGSARDTSVSSLTSGRKPLPPSGRNRAPPRTASHATREGEMDATMGENEALAPSAAAVAAAEAAALPSRPSAGVWFTSRRFEGPEGPPRTPAAGGDSPTSVGAGCAPTPSPDLLSFRAGRKANATTAATATGAHVSDVARGRREDFGNSSGAPPIACEGRGAGGGASEKGVTGSTAAPCRGIRSELGVAAVGGGEGSKAEPCCREHQNGKRKREGKRGTKPVTEVEPKKRGGKMAAGGNGDSGE